MTSPENEHRNQAQNAADRARDPSPAKTRFELEREAAPIDTWTPKNNNIGGFCHLVQEFLDRGMYPSPVIPAEFPALGVMQSWARGTLPTKYDHIALAGFLGLSIKTVNRYALRQWLHTYRDLDKYPLNTTREAGSIIFMGMIHAGLWFNDLKDVTGFVESASRRTIGLGKRVKPRVQATMRRRLSLAIPNFGDQPEPFGKEWPAIAERRARARAYAKGISQEVPLPKKEARVVPFTATPPATPQQPVVSKSEDNAHLEHGAAWRQLAKLVQCGFLHSFVTEELATIKNDPARFVLTIKQNDGTPVSFDLGDDAAYRAVSHLRTRATEAATNASKLLIATGGALQSAKL